jgi:hypothetical protein
LFKLRKINILMDGKLCLVNHLSSKKLLLFTSDIYD